MAEQGGCGTLILALAKGIVMADPRTPILLIGIFVGAALNRLRVTAKRLEVEADGS